jgi:hypothetical protein
MHGPSLVGGSRSLALTLGSYAKGEAYRLSTALGVQQLLVRSRNSSLDQEETALAGYALDEVLATDVPGLTEPGSFLLEAA